MRGALTYIMTFCIGLGVSYTQPNLILNPSVEDTEMCYDIGSNNFRYIQFWSKSNSASPDYFHTCHTIINTSQPLNSLGYQMPNTGDAYFGLLTTNQIPGVFRESVQGKFSEPLQKNRKYCFEFYTVKANYYGYALNEFGIYLSKDSIYSNNVNNLDLLPYYPININYLQDTLNWSQFSIEINNYEDNIQYFVFGNFQSESGLKYKLVDSNVTDTSNKSTYYYFDDFALYDCGEADSKPVDTASINFPTVFTPNGDGINEVLHLEGLPPGSQIEIYNRWGDFVYKAYPYTEPWDGNKNGHPCPEGVYHYIVQLPDGQTVRKFVHLFR